MAQLRKDDLQNLQSPPAAVTEHPLFNGSTSVGMISGENPRFPVPPTMALPGDPAPPRSGHEALGVALKQMGLKAEPRDGRYGAPEKSYMVYGPSREQMYQLGKQFGQESVVYTEGGKPELMYTNGPNTGRYHPMVNHEWFNDEPEDYYTHMPELGGYLRLNFDWDTLHPSNLGQNAAIDALNTRNGVGGPGTTPDGDVSKAEIAKELLSALKKAVATYQQVGAAAPAFPRSHPNAYPWHNEHTDHHKHVASPGVVLVSRASGNTLTKADPPAGVDHIEHPTNDQAAPAGVSTYAKYALPYGAVDKSSPSDLFHYPYHGKALAVNQLLKDHGYTPYYAGGKYGRPDLANRNYNTKHLMIYDPSPDSGASFGQEEYTDNWRKVHELAHALSYPELNQVYGEGRRIGKLGNHRTLREALRAVHWEHLAAHKQRELNKQLGIHVPDHVFNKEYNTVMHDAVHRAVTGKFTDPSQEGFRPHEYHVPLETALGMVREGAHNLGLTGMHDLIKKSEDNTMADEKTYGPREWRKLLAKALQDRVDAYAQQLLELRKRELAKSAAPAAVEVAPAIQLNPLDNCPLCGRPDLPGKCACMNGPLAKSEKCAECSKKAHSLLTNHTARALDDEGDRNAMARTLAPHLGGMKAARSFTEQHESRALDDSNDYRAVHSSLASHLHKRHGIQKDGMEYDAGTEDPGMAKADMCKSCGKSGAMCKCMGKAELEKGIILHDACNCSSPKPSKLKGGPCQNCRKPIASGVAVAGDKSGKPYPKSTDTKKAELSTKSEPLKKSALMQRDILASHGLVARSMDDLPELWKIYDQKVASGEIDPKNPKYRFGPDGKLALRQPGQPSQIKVAGPAAPVSTTAQPAPAPVSQPAAAAPAPAAPSVLPTQKTELSTKAKEPVKPAGGNGLDPKKLKKGDFGASDNGKVSTLPTPAGAAPKLPGKGRTFGMADLTAGKAKLQGAGVKPISPLGAPKPMAAAPAPAPGVAGLKPPPVPAASGPKLPTVAPKIPKVSAAPALPKPAAAAPAAPKTPGVTKSDPATDDLKKNLGSCVLCGKGEHTGQCK